MSQFYSTHLRDTGFLLTLDELGQRASTGRSPAETVMSVVALVADRFEADVCSAYLLEPDRVNLVLAATVGLRPECIGSLRLGLHEGLVGLIAEQVRPVAVDQVRAHPRFKYFRQAGEDAYQSLLGVPVIEDGVLQGTLVIQTVERREFSEEEIEALTAAAAQVAPIISEARSLDQFTSPTRRSSGRSRGTSGGAGTMTRPASSGICRPHAGLLEAIRSRMLENDPKVRSSSSLPARRTRTTTPASGCCRRSLA